MKYSFFDDYSEGAHPEILKYISENNNDQQLGYCKDDYCNLATERIRNALSTPNADVHYLPTGTICNIVGLKYMLKPFEGVISTNHGHINTFEAGAIEATGQKIVLVNSADGKLTPDLIDEALSTYSDEHTVCPKVVYITQVTDVGTVYSLDELKIVIDYAKSKDLLVYLDGARLAMAVVSKKFKGNLTDLGKLGIDMFYLGGAKNGGLLGEAMVVLNDKLKPYFRNHMRQRGALMAKGRFMGLQYARFFDKDELWINLAKHANAMAERLYNGLVELGVEFDLVPGANQAFPTFPNKVIEELKKDYGFYTWEKVDNEKTKIRLVCSWATPENKVDEFLADVKKLLN